MARIDQLDRIEKDVIGVLQTAGNFLQEISKDRPAQKTADQLCQQVLDQARNVFGLCFTVPRLNLGYDQH